MEADEVIREADSDKNYLPYNIVPQLILTAIVAGIIVLCGCVYCRADFHKDGSWGYGFLLVLAYEEVQYEPPRVILQKLRSLEDEIRADLNALEALLSDR